MIKVLNKKLNRTVLFKESTQWAYLSSKMFLDFFNENEEHLKEQRDSQIDFDLYIKKEFLTEEKPEPCKMHLVYCPNNKEIRVNGQNFSKYLNKINACECDNLVLETCEKDGNIFYLMSVGKKKNLVITKYSKKDVNSKEETVNNDLLNYWWFWDNNLTENEFENFISAEHIIKYNEKKKTEDKIIKFEPITEINKFMSKSKGYVKKHLYNIVEKFGDTWIPVDFGTKKLLEFELQDNTYIVTSRKENDLEYIEMGV